MDRRGMLQIDDFVAIIKQLPPTVKLIRLNYAGEPLLNKNIFKMIGMLKELRPDISTHISTNGTVLHTFDMDEIINCGLTSIAICLDGATKKSHETYRVKSDFDEICRNARALCEHKQKRKASSPVIIMQSLINGLTYQEIPAMKRLAQDIGFDKLHLRYMWMPGIMKGLNEYNDTLKKKVTTEHVDNTIKRYVENLPKEYSMYYKKNGQWHIRDEAKKCLSFLSPLIYYNGDMSVCCHDPMAEEVFANLLQDGWERAVDKLPATKVYNKQFRICNGCTITNEGVNTQEIWITKKPKIESEATTDLTGTSRGPLS
jgi:MoaA/NifB/PqqE/SkfB family radical SAM enzyme